jgi:hypothetical protein
MTTTQTAAGADAAGAPKVDVAALLKKAGQAPAGVRMEEFNPLENIPTASVGEEIQPGMTITGYFKETQRIASNKFKFATEKDERGVPVQLLHVFRLVSGDMLGIWNSGELKLLCSRLAPDELVSLTYKGKGINGNGQQQHFFEYKKAVPGQH